MVLLTLVFTSIPAVLLVAPHIVELSAPLNQFAWLLLSWSVTLSGNLTNFSSVAGVIVCEYAKSVEPLELIPWMKYAVPSTLVRERERKG